MKQMDMEIMAKNYRKPDRDSSVPSQRGHGVRGRRGKLTVRSLYLSDSRSMRSFMPPSTKPAEKRRRVVRLYAERSKGLG